MEPGAETWTWRNVHGQTGPEGHAWAEPIPRPALPKSLQPVLVHSEVAVHTQREHPTPSLALGKALVHLPHGWDRVGMSGMLGGKRGVMAALPWGVMELPQLLLCPRWGW